MADAKPISLAGNNIIGLKPRALKANSSAAQMVSAILYSNVKR